MKERQSKFLRKDESGRDIFYPWGCPGEGFYVDDKQKKHIAVFSKLVGLLFIFSVFGPDLLISYDLDNFHIRIFMYIISWIIFPFLYCGYIYFFTKKLMPYISATKESPEIISILLWMFILQVLIISAGLYVSSASVLLKSLLIVVIIIYSIAILLSFFNKGYFLQRMRSNS